MGAGTEPDGSSRSDEEWERFLRESVAGSADAPKEPSARAREVAGRLRTEPRRGLDGRRDHRPARSRRPVGRYVVGLLAVLALLFVALAPGRVVDLVTGSDVSRPDARRATAQDPFRGSPATAWASGTAGITMPKETKAVGGMSAAEVGRALNRSRDFLAASSLDRAVLRGERPEKAIALINPHQKDVQHLLKTAFQAPGEKNDPLLLFSRFQPSRAHLVGDIVKTRGALTYREGERGALRATADVTFVYPVARPGGDEILRTIVRRELVLSWDDPDKVHTEPGTFSVVSYNYDMTNGGCGTPTGYFVPPFGPDHDADESGREVDPYDRGTPFGQGGSAGSAGSAGDECGRATRS
ncbi:hypothetical protein D0Z67_04805 [Streptomyces seoulensis]|uniref:Uncharacterized protein n=1 Tax=Streptomyces seoulensis TaxID=73044 RepID=A0A4P6TR42_STRSO|nr:hypothetical protein [Streptomyces seoulensis]QBJ89690.1 hypothetical protein D0Z67_04805 [Streptomyces seoulensis]